MTRWVQGIVVVVGLALGAAAKEVPAPLGRVSDYAGVIDAGSKAELESLIHSVEAATTAEIAVVTVVSLEGEPIEDAAVRWFQAWGIGKKGKDNGVLVMVSVQDRAARIEVGYGLEPILTDGICGNILREKMFPAFREGRPAAGLLAGVQEMARRLEGGGGVESPKAAPAIPEFAWLKKVLVLFLFGLLLGLLTGWGGLIFFSFPVAFVKIWGFLSLGIFVGALIRTIGGIFRPSSMGWGGGAWGGGGSWGGGGGFGSGGFSGGFGGGSSGGGGASGKW